MHYNPKQVVPDIAPELDSQLEWEPGTNEDQWQKGFRRRRVRCVGGQHHKGGSRG